MPERICPNCGKTVPDWNYCAECGSPLPQLQAGAELSGSDLPPSMPPQEPTSAPTPEDEGVEEAPPPVEEPSPSSEAADGPPSAPETPPAPATEPRPSLPHDGQLRCPNCEEAVYAGERVCWNCARRLETVAPPEESPELPAVEPEPGAPVARPPVPTAASREMPSAAATPQQPLPRRTSDEAMAAAWWSFGLGLLSVFTCGVLGILGLPALWLGVSAAKRGAGPVAIAGAVFGALGLLVFLVWVLVLAFALPSMSELLRPPPTHIMVPPLP